MMQDKYSPEAVKFALGIWEYAKDLNPKEKSILSRMSMSENTITELTNNKHTRPLQTTFVITKKYPMVLSLNILGHYYKCFNDKTWHPGDTMTPTIFGSRDPRHSSVIMIEEMCDYCVYHAFCGLFYRDLNFNIMTNNCQIITGYIGETVLVILYFITLIAVIITGKFIFLVMALSIILFVILYNIFQITTNNFHVYYCPHIYHTYRLTNSFNFNYNNQ